MGNDVQKTLGRIETAMDQISARMPDSIEQAEQIDRIELLLEKLLEQAEQQTTLLGKLWKNDRARD